MMIQGEIMEKIHLIKFTAEEFPTSAQLRVL